MPATSPNSDRESQQGNGEALANVRIDADAEAEAEAELKGALAALHRAAQAARKLAKQTGTDLIVMRNGVITRVRPDEYDRT